MISTSKAAEAYNVLNKLDDSASLKGTVKIFIHDKEGNDVGVMDLYEGFEIGGGEYNDSFLNQSLNTAKKMFSRLAAGDVDYKIGKIAFGNAGHKFSNTKKAGEVSEEDVELRAAELIRTNLTNPGEEYTYTFEGNTFRLVYIEKTIGDEHVTFGEDNDQFIVRVPVSFDEFNMRVDDPEATTDSPYTDALIEYDLIDDGGALIKMGNADSDGVVVAGKTHTEVLADTGTTTFLFKNGLDGNGEVSAAGGYRPQEISEILLLTNIIGNGTTEPYQKLAASRMTSGLLSFPEGFQFTYEWTLTWNFQQA